HRLDTPHELIAPTDPSQHTSGLLSRFSPCAKQKSVDLALRNAVMPARGRHTANLFVVDPLLQRGEADSKLKGCIAQMQRSIASIGVACTFHLSVSRNNKRIKPYRASV